MTKTLNINEEFRAFLDDPSEEEIKLLESQLVRDKGPRDPITVWKGKDTIVDGHTRYKICVAHDLPFDTREIPFKDAEEVKDWILENQLGRRNLSKDRMDYYLGTLYNRSKQKINTLKTPNPDNKPTSKIIGEKFNVDEKTVRRAGLQATGIDTVGKALGLDRVSDKLNAITNKNSATAFTKGELQDIAKIKEPVLADATAKVLVNQKKAEATKKAVTGKKPETPKMPVAPSVFYEVVFSKPDFDRAGFSVQTEEKPRTTESCMIYMYVDDADLLKGIALMQRWNLTYEGSIVFKLTEGYEGNWTDVQHTFMLIGSKGVMAGLAKGTASPSIITDNGQPTDVAMIKLIEKYHPDVKRLDMRKTGTADGWDSIKK